MKVYPRVCGGASSCLNTWRISSGLSPRVRGSPMTFARLISSAGSIPACAGEPYGDISSCQRRQVYPRVCGGANYPAGKQPQSGGLSPRVRGSPPQTPVDELGQGSIPACAGEPCHSYPMLTVTTVYPRVCGGATIERAIEPSSAGLSPRVRGSRSHDPADCNGRGSIPACAGEPIVLAGVQFDVGVYPRVCGGAGLLVAGHLLYQGLSPRVRGSHHQAHPLHSY